LVTYINQLHGAQSFYRIPRLPLVPILSQKEASPHIRTLFIQNPL